MGNLEHFMRSGNNRDLTISYEYGGFVASIEYYVGHGPTLEMALIDLDAALEDWGVVQDDW